MTANEYSGVLSELDAYVTSINDKLKDINKYIYNNPEIKWEEHKAHDVLCDFLEKEGFKVTRHAYGLDTAFKCVYGEGGRGVEFNAEYDALPGIGHGCGHNLIATVGLTGFLCLAYLIKKYKVPGRAILLGTPAEEGGGGKIELLKAGAYDDCDISLMGHGCPDDAGESVGSASMYTLACAHFDVEYRGKAAHASGFPQNGINALDAAVGAYVNVSMFRQHLTANQRIHAIISDGPKAANIIPDYAKMICYVRASSREELSKLMARVEPLFEATGKSTGCEYTIHQTTPYDELRVFRSLAQRYVDNMETYGVTVPVESDELVMGSTDQGNVCYKVPSLHVLFTIPTDKNCSMHSIDFTNAAGAPKAHENATKTARSLARLGWDALTDDAYFEQIQKDWAEDVERRGKA